MTDTALVAKAIEAYNNFSESKQPFVESMIQYKRMEAAIDAYEEAKRTNGCVNCKYRFEVLDAAATQINCLSCKEIAISNWTPME